MLTLARDAALSVRPEIAGAAVVPLARLQAKLGRRAWHVWQVLCAYRDRDGFTHITVKGIGRAKGFVAMPAKSVQHALRRLELAGLVKAVGWLPRDVHRGAALIHRWVYVRRVFGAVLPDDNRGRRAAVPAVTKNWGRAAAEWGGKRTGSGRPKRGEAMKRKNQVGPTPKESSGATDIREEESKSISTSDESFFPSGKKSGAEFEPRRKAASLSSSEVAGTRSSPGPLLATPSPGLPPYPGASLIEVPRIPDPPKLREDLSSEEHAVQLATIYRKAVEKRYPGVRVFQFRNEATIRRSKHFDALIRFSEKLIEHDIPPASWVAFRVDEWRERAREHKHKAGMPELPTVNYVFSSRAIGEMRWRFRAEMGDGAIGGSVVYGKSHRELLSRFHRMHSAINRGMPKAEARARAFPGDLWDVLLDAARAESAELRRSFSIQLNRGDFLW